MSNIRTVIAMACALAVKVADRVFQLLTLCQICTRNSNANCTCVRDYSKVGASLAGGFGTTVAAIPLKAS